MTERLGPYCWQCGECFKPAYPETPHCKVFLADPGAFVGFTGVRDTCSGFRMRINRESLMGHIFSGTGQLLRIIRATIPL